MRPTLLALLVLLTGCATSHALPPAPDGGQAYTEDASPDGPECLAWGHPEGFPEDVRCTLWSDQEPGCKIAPFDRPGPGAGACVR